MFRTNSFSLLQTSYSQYTNSSESMQGKAEKNYQHNIGSSECPVLSYSKRDDTNSFFPHPTGLPCWQSTAHLPSDPLASHTHMTSPVRPHLLMPALRMGHLDRWSEVTGENGQRYIWGLFPCKSWCRCPSNRKNFAYWLHRHVGWTRIPAKNEQAYNSKLLIPYDLLQWAPGELLHSGSGSPGSGNVT